MRADAAMMLEQKDLNSKILRQTIETILSEMRLGERPALITKFEKNVRQFQFPDAAAKIVERLLPPSVLKPTLTVSTSRPN